MESRGFSHSAEAAPSLEDRRSPVPQLLINLCRRSIRFYLCATGKNLVLGITGSSGDSDSHSSDIDGDHCISMEKERDEYVHRSFKLSIHVE